ncbi:tetratricopeptide repeat protein [Schinkia azotoformans]|uniref:TPR-repeat containing protein n=1 Tax=Schinkia azotoformans LMG 9581 TaxID=1131731 RepID=K6C864_SCHAZ|nr:tetratricopeptide repeat protein [Schinkia azotoformans]EKN67340.1 TPR -repeat containing protein [Schinkia azotoformans LMG 9581]MEC1639407.1 tetratricopeptide repeat protein [Schinkia azotoformans]MEC1944339.1 tetratricopeptide repeat protein [Schinkia azotoformans]
MDEKLLKAIQLVENGNINEGLQYLHSLIDISNHEEKLMIADLYLQWGFLDEAKEIVNELLELYPDEGQLYIYAAEIAIEQDYEGDALDYLEEIKEDDPAYLQALILMADMFQMQGLDEAAEQKLLKAKRLAPEEALIDLGLGQFYSDIGEYQKAIPFFRNLIDTNVEIEHANVHLLLADAFVHTGCFEEALASYEKGLTNKIEINGLFNYGLMAYQLERYELAVAKWNELKLMDPDYVPVYLYLAKAYEQMGALNESYQTTQEGLQIDPEYKELLVFAAKIAMKIQNDKDVEAHLVKAIEIDSGFVEAIHLLSSYYLFHEQYEEVVSLLETAVAGDEYDPQFDWDLAVAKNNLDRYKDALNHYENAYTSFKDNIQFLQDFGYFLLEDGDQKRAKDMFERILEIDPQCMEIEEELLRLEGK